MDDYRTVCVCVRARVRMCEYECVHECEIVSLCERVCVCDSVNDWVLECE